MDVDDTSCLRHKRPGCKGTWVSVATYNKPWQFKCTECRGIDNLDDAASESTALDQLDDTDLYDTNTGKPGLRITWGWIISGIILVITFILITFDLESWKL